MRPTVLHRPETGLPERPELPDGDRRRHREVHAAEPGLHDVQYGQQ